MHSVRFDFLPIIGVGISILAAVSGCGRVADPDRSIDSTSVRAFGEWRTEITKRFTQEQWEEFDMAIQELRYRAMSSGRSGSDAVTMAVHEQIHGLTFYGVLQAGYEARLARLQGLVPEFARIIDGYALLIPKDAESAGILKDRRQYKQAEADNLIKEIRAAHRRYVEIGGVPMKSVMDLDSVQPTRLSRADALKGFQDLVERRRRIGQSRFGDWPVQITRDSSRLPLPERKAFELARDAVPTTGHAVIAVRLKRVWHIFDDHVDQPAFSEAVMANLAPADRQLVSQRWEELQAELWARESAADKTSEISGTLSVGVSR